MSALLGRLRSRVPVSGETTPVVLALAATVVVLVLLGLLMTFSSSFVQSAETYGDAFSIFRRQLAWCLLGIVPTVIVATHDYRRLQRLAAPLLVLSLLLAIAVVIPDVGIERNGSRRWLGVEPVSFQPAELLKLTVPLFCADLLARRWGRLRSGELSALLMPILPLLLLVAGLVAAEPDLETAALLVAIGLAVLFTAGLPIRWLASATFIGTTLVVFGITSVGFRRGRFDAWLDPLAFSSDFGYQTLQGYLALGSGGWLGTGLGASRGKWLFLPNAHTDFIFAIIGEELGLAGALVVLLLYLVLAVAGVRTARLAPDPFGRLLAAGLTSAIMLQAVLNMGSVVGLLPVTGVTLPLVSFGGTSLVVTMISAGILMSIARHARSAPPARTPRRGRLEVSKR